MLHALLNPGIIGITALFLAVVWMLRDEKDKTRPLLVIALVVNLFYGLLLSIVMGKENGIVPWKYDYVLSNMDRALGLNATPIAVQLHGGLRLPLAVVYQLMVPMMVAWFLVARASRASGSIVIAYVAEMLVGPILYAVVPACGPAYAFRSNWLIAPAVRLELVRFDGMPNAFPSLHVATALLFVLYAPNRKWRGVALLFLAGTVCATLSTGEHYVIDLIAGLPFGCFAGSVGRRTIARSIAFLGLVLCWSLSVRFGYQLLITHAAVLRCMAVLTLLGTAANVAFEWRANRGVTEPSEAPSGIQAY